MAERVRIGTFSSGGRFVPVLDVNDGSTFKIVMDSIQLPAAEATRLKTGMTRRWGAPRQVTERHQEAMFGWVQWIDTAASDTTLTAWNSLAEQIHSDRPGRFIEWRPNEASKSVYYQIIGTAPWQVEYSWVKFGKHKMLEAPVQFPVEPLAFGDPMDIFDDFSVDSISDYTFDSGSGTIAVSGGQLVPSTTAAKNFHHSARGYVNYDAEVTLKLTAGASASDSRKRVQIKKLNSNDAVCATVDGSNLLISKFDSGTESTLVTTSTSLSANGTYWLRGRMEANVVFAELWTSEPTPTGTPTASVSHTLSSSDAAKYGRDISGYAGVRIDSPGGTDWRYDEFRVEPYTYKRIGTQTVAAQEFDLFGVPGTAPAQITADLTQPDTVSRRWGLLGWMTRPDPYSYVWNGDLSTPALGTSGWSNAGSGLTTGSTLARQTGAGKFGLGFLRITSHAATNSGGAFKIYRRFRQGVPYTLRFWADEDSGNWQAALGQFGTDSSGSSTITTTGGTWTEGTVTWIPSADRDWAEAIFRQSDSSSGNVLNVDGVQVYEGAVQPTAGKHGEGQGALLPFGLIEAENERFAGALLPIVSDSTASGGFLARDSSVAAAEGENVEILIDPSLLAADEFVDEVAIEFWGMAQTDTANRSGTANPTMWLDAYPFPNDSAFLNGRRADGGVREVRPPGSNDARSITRLGTIMFPIDPARAARRWLLNWQAVLPAGTPTGSFGLDALIAVPLRQRIANPTGRHAESEMPPFMGTDPPGGYNADAVRVQILPDLRRRRSSFSWLPPAEFPSAIGGSPLEFPAGDVQVLLKTSDCVPDYLDASPTADTNSFSTIRAHFAVWPRFHLARS